MNYYFLLFIALLLLVFAIMQARKRKIAVIINHRKKYRNKELFKMRELAEKFIGKECLIYTIASDSNSVKGTVKEITDNGLLIENDGNLQAVNLEYVTRICEWPRKKTVRRRISCYKLN